MDTHMLEFTMVGLIATALAVTTTHWWPMRERNYAITLWFGLATIIIGETITFTLAGQPAIILCALIGALVGALAIYVLHAQVAIINQAGRFWVYSIGTGLTIVIQSLLLDHIGRITYAPVLLAFGLAAGAICGAGHALDWIIKNNMRSQLWQEVKDIVSGEPDRPAQT